jgi:nucleotide-binding universal stress UspA family protein
MWSTSVGRGLHVLAETEGADLIVVGSSRRGVVGRVLLGDDTRAALNGAPCAVAVAPAGYVEHPRDIRRIGVGYDGSLESEHALEVARGLAAEHEAKLSACTAVSVPLAAFKPGPLPLSDAIDALVADAGQRIAALEVEPHAVYGATGEVLTSYSAALDLLVVGSRGYGPIGRLVHGSTSNELARTAQCPLLILPRATRSTAGQSGAVERGQTSSVD